MKDRCSFVSEGKTDRKGRDWEMKERGRGFRGDLPLNVLSGQKGNYVNARSAHCDLRRIATSIRCQPGVTVTRAART